MDDSLKWIKLAVNIFENRKIQYIETMPDADTILVIWFKLLTLAGTINDCGQIYMTREIPYTEEMLAAHFKRPLNTVRLALQIFEKLDMIEIVDDFTKLTNWEKYQNTEALATAREKGRLRVQAFRERQKLAQIEEKEPCGSGVNERNVTVTLRNAVDKNREEENRKEKIIKDNNKIDQNIKQIMATEHKHPGLAQIVKHCKEKGYTDVNPVEFLNYYLGKPVMMGKHPLDEWESLLEKWNREKWTVPSQKPNFYGSFPEA